MVRSVNTVPARPNLLLVDLICAVLSGAGLWASFPSMDFWWLTIPSMALFISRVDTARFTRAVLVSTISGLAFWFPHTDWALPATGGWLPWVALAVSQVFFFALWGAIVSLIRTWPGFSSPFVHCCVIATTWVGVEQLRSRWPWSGFPWGNLAYPQVDSPLGHLAPYGGEVCVSFAVVVAAVLLRRALSLHPDMEVSSCWSRPVFLFSTVALVLVPWLIPLPLNQEAGSVRVGVVQGNIEIPALETYREEGKVTDNHARQMRTLIDEEKALDLVIWGEASVDRDPEESAVVSQIISEVVDDSGVPTIVGFPRRLDDGRLNLIGLWYPHEGLDPVHYGKQIPVPFGEFIPLRGLVSRLATEAAQISVDLLPVDNVARLDVRVPDGRTVPLAVGICFESAYEQLIGEGVTAGGQIIVVPTNNYHFRDRAESVQQAQILRFRALEFSRSAVQGSTTGVSALIRPDGSIHKVSGTMRAAHLAGDLPLRTSLTLAARMGHWPAWTVMGATLFLVVVAGVRLFVGYFRRPQAKSRRKR